MTRVLHAALACAVAVLDVTDAGLRSVHAAPLRIGMYPSYPPLDMRDTGTDELKGFDVDLGDTLARRMGYRPQIVETSFAQLIPSLLTGRIHMFFNGMMDTPTRRQTIAFVDYLRSGLQFITLREDEQAPRSLPELCGKMVAASRITSEPARLIAWSQRNCTAKGLPAVQLFASENSADARLQLREGRVVAVLQDSLTAPWILQTNAGVFNLLGGPFDLTPLGVGVSKDAPALLCQTASALSALHADGTYLALIHKWHLPPSSAIISVTLPAGCPDHED